MGRGRGNQLTKQVGEFLVAAELARRGWLAAVLSGNTPDFDLVATDVDGRSVPVQVKAIRGGSWQLNAAKFADIRMDGKRQIVGVPKPYPPNLVCVLVVVGDSGGTDRFFVMPMRTLQQMLLANYKRWLRKHSGVRPKNPESTHGAVLISEVGRYEGNWEEIGKALD